MRRTLDHRGGRARSAATVRPDDTGNQTLTRRCDSGAHREGHGPQRGHGRRVRSGGHGLPACGHPTRVPCVARPCRAAPNWGAGHDRLSGMVSLHECHRWPSPGQLGQRRSSALSFRGAQREHRPVGNRDVWGCGYPRGVRYGLVVWVDQCCVCSETCVIFLNFGARGHVKTHPISPADSVRSRSQCDNRHTISGGTGSRDIQTHPYTEARCHTADNLYGTG